MLSSTFCIKNSKRKNFEENELQKMNYICLFLSLFLYSSKYWHFLCFEVRLLSLFFFILWQNLCSSSVSLYFKGNSQLPTMDRQLGELISSLVVYWYEQMSECRRPGSNIHSFINSLTHLLSILRLVIFPCISLDIYLQA